jgi:hypothetical protein
VQHSENVRNSLGLNYKSVVEEFTQMRRAKSSDEARLSAPKMHNTPEKLLTNS